MNPTRFIALAVFFSLLATPSIAYAQNQDEARKKQAEIAFSKAKQLDQEMRFADALKYYKKACSLIDNYKDCKSEIRISEKLLANEREIRSRPRDAKLLSDLAINYKWKGHYEKAFDLSLRSYDIKPTAKAAKNLAIAYYDKGLIEKSLEMAEVAVQLDKDDFVINVVYIGLLIENGRIQQGKEMLQSFSDEKIDKNKQWYNVSCSYATLGDVKNAVKYLSRAINYKESQRLQARRDKSFDKVRKAREFRSLVYPEETKRE